MKYRGWSGKGGCNGLDALWEVRRYTCWWECTECRWREAEEDQDRGGWTVSSRIRGTVPGRCTGQKTVSSSDSWPLRKSRRSRRIPCPFQGKPLIYPIPSCRGLGLKWRRFKPRFNIIIAISRFLPPFFPLLHLSLILLVLNTTLGYSHLS